MMTLRRPALLGAGMVAATRRQARRTAVRVGPAGRGRRVCVGAGQGSRRSCRRSATSGARRQLLCGGGGACGGLLGHGGAVAALGASEGE